MIKEIPDFAPYVVSDTGEVYNGKRMNHGPLSTWIDNVGYEMVVLHKNNKRHYCRVHRLVAITFIPNPDNKPQVNHIDGNKTNNNVSNLEWIDNAENTQHGYDMGAYPKSRQVSVVAIDKDDTKKRFQFPSIRSMCKALLLNRKTVSRILEGSKVTNNYHYNFQFA